jgi:peptidyl-prolyl cis-trans isomerase B (cyclophilin B)
MQHIQHRRVLAATGVLVTALLAGCGGGGGYGGTPSANLATVTSTTVAPAKYSQSMLITLQGTYLDQGLTVTSAGCKNMALSTTAPNVSSATTAYYTCTVSGVGAQTVVVTRSDGLALPGASYTIAVPQVTMVISNTGVVQPVMVITLEAAKAPITTTNFLAYVNAGFYTGTVFHRHVPGFIVQGGGYAGPLVAGGTVPTPKTPINPTIVLEDNVGLSNTLMTLAMARTNVFDSASSQFFVNLANNGGPTGLDATATTRGYAVFGTITAGGGLLTTMLTGGCSAWPAFFGSLDSTACLPSPNITILSATQTQ